MQKMGRYWKIRRYFRSLLWITLCLAGLFGVAYYMGRPMPSQKFEVDVTDKIAEWANSAPPAPVTLRPTDEVK